jgi:hypothetical protein
MVTRRAAGVLRPVDWLILAAATSSTPPDASPVPSSVRTALADYRCTFGPGLMGRPEARKKKHGPGTARPEII